MEIMQGLTSPEFDTIWMGQHNWYEEPNIRRGGWSGVRKVDIETLDGVTPVYLKQQLHHSYRSWTNLFIKQPTAVREYRNIRRLHKVGVPTLDVVIFAVKGDAAILGTRALEGYQALDEIDLNRLTLQQRRALIRSVARCISRLHQHHYQHNCLYPKHIFVRQFDDKWSIKLIDLEKMKRRWRRNEAMKHDLDTLYRRSLMLFNQRDCITFMRAYLSEQKASSSQQRRFLRRFFCGRVVDRPKT